MYGAADVGRIVCLVATVLAAAAVLRGAGLALTIPLGAILVLVLPGYAWLGMLRHRESEPLARGALIVMTSIGLAIVLGLGLNFLSGGLTSRAWALGLTAVTVTGLAASLFRGRSGPRDGRPLARVRAMSPATGLKITLIILLVAATGALSVVSQKKWLGRQHLSVLALSRSSAAPIVYVRNLEGRPITYTLTVWVDRRVSTRWQIRLGSGHQFNRALDRAVMRNHKVSTLKVTLDRAGTPSPYRVVFIRRPAHV